MSTVTAPPAASKPARSPRKPYVATDPITGTFRWAAQPTDAHPGCLVITSHTKRGPVTHAYLVHTVKDAGRLVGYRLEKAGGVVYDLAADLSSCDCGDATFQPERPGGGCKHRKALRAALAALETA